MSIMMNSTAAAGTDEAARACLYAVVDRFNTDDAFWGSFVPAADATDIGEDAFTVSLDGRGVRITVRGTLMRGLEDGPPIVPQLVVGAVRQGNQGAPKTWHPITCSVNDEGRFVTSNFRAAIESAISDL